MSIRDEIERIRDLSDKAQQLNALKKKVAEDFDRGILTHQRLDMYNNERENILKGVISNIKA
jgi:hypothetical protein